MKFELSQRVYADYANMAMRDPGHAFLCEYSEFKSPALGIAYSVLKKPNMRPVRFMMLGSDVATHFLYEPSLCGLLAQTRDLETREKGHLGCMLGADVWSDSFLPEKFIDRDDLLIMTEDSMGGVGVPVLVRLHLPQRGMRPLRL
jgi:hypothetical protein